MGFLADIIRDAWLPAKRSDRAMAVEPYKMVEAATDRPQPSVAPADDDAIVPPPVAPGEPGPDTSSAKDRPQVLLRTVDAERAAAPDISGTQTDAGEVIAQAAESQSLEAGDNRLPAAGSGKIADIYAEPSGRIVRLTPAGSADKQREEFQDPPGHIPTKPDASGYGDDPHLLADEDSSDAAFDVTIPTDGGPIEPGQTSGASNHTPSLTSKSTASENPLPKESLLPASRVINRAPSDVSQTLNGLAARGDKPAAAHQAGTENSAASDRASPKEASASPTSAKHPESSSRNVASEQEDASDDHPFAVASKLPLLLHGAARGAFGRGRQISNDAPRGPTAPNVQIGQIDVIVQSPPTDTMPPPSRAWPSGSLTSRYYLRRL